MSIIEIARLFLFVREVPPNAGLRVMAIQQWGGGRRGDSWCCWFATMILDLFFAGNSPIPRMGSCEDVYSLAKTKGWLTDTPVPGDLFLYVDDNDHAHHIGLVTVAPRVGLFGGLAGNTSADGKSSNGDRVAERSLSVTPHVKFVHYPR